MKKIKSILSFLLIFIMIAGIMPAVHAEDSITIEGLNLPVNMTKSVKFYLKNMPAGFGKATVDIDDTNVRTISEVSANTFYRVELEPKDYPAPGTHVVKISAGDAVVTKEVEFYYPAFNTNAIDTDMNNLADLSSVSTSNVKKALGDNVSSISLGSGSGTTLEVKNALGTKDATDYSLAFVRTTATDSTTSSYMDVSLPSSVNSGIVELQFSVYREGSSISNFRLSSVAGSTLNLVSNITQSNIWYNVRLVVNLDKKTYAYEFDNNGGAITSANGTLSSNTMSKIRINIRPKDNTANVYVAVDDLRMDAYTPVTKEVMITSPADGDSVISSDALAVNVSAPDSDSVTLYADGTQLQTNSAANESGDYTFTINAEEVAYGLKDIRAIAFSGATPIGADSVNINWNGQLNSVAYTVGADPVSTVNTIPVSAKSVSLVLSDASEATDSAELYVDGEITEHNGVIVSDNVVTVSLPKLSASSDVKIVLKGTSDLSAYFNVTDETGFYAKVINYNISSDAAGAVVHSIAPSDMAANAYVATYMDKCLNELSVKPLTIKEGKSYAAITKNNLSAFETAKIMLWGENLKPIIGAVSNE